MNINKTLLSTCGLTWLALTQVSTAQNWWTISDKDFAQKFGKLATSNDIKDQSSVSWMLFARVNQQVTQGSQTVSKWETWPSNDDTFSPAVRAFAKANKVRTRPHFVPSKKTRLAAFSHVQTPSAGEEVARNLDSYGYIHSQGLNTKQGVFKRLAQSSPVNFPLGAIEIKADWGIDRKPGDNPGAYKFVTPNVTYSLLGLHIMAKMAPTPNSPFTSEDPSWFWTTFEYKNNPGLANALKLITYNDVLSQTQSQALLTQAGLGGSAFNNYVCNGTQIRFSDQKNPKIVLGNTTMEGFAGVPQGPPSKWTSWNASCHNCHAQASGDPKTNVMPPSINGSIFAVETGPITPPVLKQLNGFVSVDFVWSIPLYAR